jgi:hypothetical protein
MMTIARAAAVVTMTTISEARAFERVAERHLCTGKPVSRGRAFSLPVRGFTLWRNPFTNKYLT